MVRLQYAFADYKTAQKYLARYEKATRRFSPEALALAYKVYEKQNNRRIAKNYASMLVKMFPTSYQAKQYILNELAHIEADDLAETFQASKINTTDSAPTKRVVVLSPNKPRKNAPKKVITEEIIAEKVKTKKELPKTEVVAETVNVKKNQSKAINDFEIKIHIVKKGESLYSISKRYNINMNALEHWNNLSRNDVLILGRKLYVSVPLHLNPASANNVSKNTEQEKAQ
jgi:type IV pilus assembly protein PilF